MRTAPELVAQLDLEASTHARSTVARINLGIVVRDGREYGGNIVWHERDDRHLMLEALIKNGDEPIGLVLVTDEVLTGGDLTISRSLCEEYASDPKADELLTEICRHWAFFFRDRLACCGEKRTVVNPNGSSAWVDSLGS